MEWSLELCPVLLQEVREFLAVRPGEWCIDGTVGDGEDPVALPEAAALSGQLLGIDADLWTQEHARRRLHPATRTFQAISMLVNRELKTWKAALAQATRMLARGDRLAVIAYHSLEDRRLRRFFGARPGTSFASCISQMQLA